jgi:hypothetical protein
LSSGAGSLDIVLFSSGLEAFEPAQTHEKACFSNQIGL